MIAADIISNEIPPLKTSDTGIKALVWMDEFKISHLPIVNQRTFLGLLAEEDIYSFNKPEEAIGSHSLSLPKPFVKNTQHIFEALRLITNMDLSILPVLDEKENYIGLITPKDLLKKVTEISAITGTGGILVLEVNERDYSLAQLAHIIESNDAKILSVYLRSVPDTTMLEVVIKLNRTDLSTVKAALYRYNYNVIGSFMSNNVNDVIDDRYDILMNYLNI